MESSKVYLKEIESVLLELIKQENIDTSLSFQLSKNEEYDIQCNDFVKFKDLPNGFKTKIENEISNLGFIEVCYFPQIIFKYKICKYLFRKLFDNKSKLRKN